MAEMAEMAETESPVLQERAERQEIVEAQEKVGLKDSADIKENQDRKVTTDIRGFEDHQEQQGSRDLRVLGENQGDTEGHQDFRDLEGHLEELRAVDKPMLGGGGQFVLRIKELNWCIQEGLGGAGTVRLVEQLTISVCLITPTISNMAQVSRVTAMCMG